MNVEFRGSFTRDLQKIRDNQLKERIRELILQIEQANTLDEIANVKKLKGSNEYFRIRIGDYRVGIKLSGETIAFVRFLHRRDIYRYFP